MQARRGILEGQQWNGLLSYDEVQLAEQAAEALCEELRPEAVALVDAFDYPDRVLNSCLGAYDGNVYESLYDNARNSELNACEVFDGYEELLRPHLDLDFLRQRSPLPSATEQQLPGSGDGDGPPAPRSSAGRSRSRL